MQRTDRNTPTAADERDLREREERYEAVVKQSPDGIFLVDLGTRRILEANPALGRLLGYSAEELLELGLYDIVAHERADIDRNIQRIVSQRERFLGERRYRRKDRSLVEVEVSVSLISYGGREAVSVVARDITERRRAEENARASLSLQRVRNEILQMRDAGDWERVLAEFRDQLSTLVDFNMCSINLVDRDAGSMVVHHTHPDEAPPSHAHAIAPAVRRALESGRPVYRASHAAMERFGEAAMLGDVKAVVDVPFAGGTIAMNSTTEAAFGPRDIALLEQFGQVMSEAHRRLEDLQALATQEEQLRRVQRMEAIGELTRGIAHNFNNMLQIAMGNIDLSLEQAPANLRPLLDNAQVAAQRAADMVQQLVVFSQQDLELEHGPVDMRSVLRRTVDMCREAFDRRIDLVLEADQPLAVRGDPRQLEQVVLNLCLNARDALEEEAGSAPRIFLALDRVPATPEEHRAHPALGPGSHVRLKVADNGRGMDVDTRQRVFDPFFTTKDVGKGTGLGLATVGGIVQQHRGWIECESEPGAGSTFLVYLPEAEPEASPPPVPEAGLPRGTETVLIVDDEPLVRRHVRMVLEQCGYTVLEAEDGRSALELFRRERDRIALILLDLSMPGMSGQEVLPQVRALEPAVPVVVFTGYVASEEDFVGVQAVVRKPVRLAALALRVRELLDAAVARPESPQ